jgi:hypothetical protein
MMSSHILDRACRAVLVSHINATDPVIEKIQAIAEVAPYLSDANPERAAHLAITLLELTGDLANTLAAETDALAGWLKG